MARVLIATAFACFITTLVDYSSSETSVPSVINSAQWSSLGAIKMQLTGQTRDVFGSDWMSTRLFKIFKIFSS
jgi:hypothetical protein